MRILEVKSEKGEHILIQKLCSEDTEQARVRAVPTVTHWIVTDPLNPGFLSQITGSIPNGICGIFERDLSF